MDSSQDDYYYSIVHLFPTGQYRFDIKSISVNLEYFIRCNTIAPRKNVGDEPSFISDCTKVATYIENDYSKWLTVNKTDRCKYLNYAINDLVKNDGAHNYKEENLIQAYNKLATQLSECNNNIKSIEKSVFNKVKELSNIYYEFDKYLKAIKANQTIDCQGLSNIVQLYLNNQNSCKSENKKFCVAVDKFKNDYLSEISQVNCEKKDSKLKSFLSLGDTVTVTFEGEEEGREELDEKSGRDRSATEYLQVRPHVEQAVLKENLESTPFVETFKSEESEGFNSSPTTFPGIEVHSESIMNKNVSTIGATFAGSSLFLVMMYKYTPLGSWVSTKILGRNKLMENMNKNHYELLLNDVRNGEMSLNDTTYSISYKSASK
ncbi:Plasmodium vivax Vir protein, putative [Plasmodium vivax]|uniref:Vir protein, putative n=1 Tax=Plasmodium vivax TaxID=5855 RepID=A0A1G4EG55_PLAVI|nr:Plasmodium vivax Vir protein, putative [Plasmodium vivax]